MTPNRLRAHRLALPALLLLLAPASARAVDVEPLEIRLDGADARQQVVVSRTEADGSLSDLTRTSRFRVEPSSVAIVDASGLVRPQADGRATLVVEAAGETAEVPVVVERAATPRPVSYRHDVRAVLARAGCNMGACHGNLNGKGGFKLSLRGDDPDFDLLALTRDAHGRRVDRTRPERSLILRKPTGQIPHEGGQRFRTDAPEARTLRAWVAAGTVDDRATAPALVRLSVFPEDRRLAASSPRQQLAVTAEFADGTRRDVTRQAAFDLSDPLLATVTAGGRVEASRPGEVAVAIRYLDGRAVSRLAFLPDRPDFAWDGPEPKNLLDEHVFARLKALKINPSPTAPDGVFLRRAYLDALGVLPTPEEARAFLDDPDPGKRAKLVDRLLERPEFADFWALKWADLLRNEEKVMGPKGVWVFRRWLRDQVSQDMPLDDFARRLVSTTGSTWANPAASFHRTNRDPTAAAEALGQVFLGVRLQCARCHNHPFDIWTQDDYYGLAAFFANVDRKEVDNNRRDKFDKHEFNGDEVVYLSGKPQLVQPSSGEMMSPKPLGAPGPDLGGDPDALDDLADWLVHDPQFARSLANRIWAHLLGRGIVDPVDDFRDSNPPSNPELLDALTAEFVAGGMRLKPLVRLIMTSATYGRSAAPNATNADDESHFARAAVKLLPAEPLLDAIGQVLDAPERFRGAPAGSRAVQLAGVRTGGEFLKVFGKPDRLLTCECERSDATTLAQAFQLINGESVRGRLVAGDNRIGRLLDAGASDAAILSELYLAALTREPTATERAAALEHVAASTDRRRAWEDVAWAILNSKEFLLRH